MFEGFTIILLLMIENVLLMLERFLLFEKFLFLEIDLMLQFLEPVVINKTEYEKFG